jgi:hypothetical protein
MYKKMATPLEKRAALEAIRVNHTGTSSDTQCTRLLAALAQYAVSTYEASRYLDIYYCPARVLQLRKQGYAITTHRVNVQTESGASHNVGLYVLEA